MSYSQISSEMHCFFRGGYVFSFSSVCVVCGISILTLTTKIKGWALLFWVLNIMLCEVYPFDMFMASSF